MTEIIAKYESLGYRDIASSTSDGVMVLARVDKEEGVAENGSTFLSQLIK